MLIFCWYGWKRKVMNAFVSFHKWKRSLGNTLKYFISLQLLVMTLPSSSLCKYFYICVCVCIFLCVWVCIYVYLTCAIYVLCVYNTVYLCLEVISILVSLLIKPVFKKAFNYFNWYKEVISEYLVQLLF